MVYNSCIQGFCFDVFASLLAEAWMRDSVPIRPLSFFNEIPKADSSPALLFIPAHLFVERVGGCCKGASECGATANISGKRYSY